jgi:hypothetical protein
MPSSINTASQTRTLRTIVKAGLLAGFLDGMDAVVYIGLISGIPVIRVFQFIASGAVGVKAFHEGLGAAALGVFFHFVIATGAASVFYALSRKLPTLLHKPLLWGPIYGMGVFLFMHYVVVPLSAAPKQPPARIASLANLIFSHIFFVGIPIAMVISREAKREK